MYVRHDAMLAIIKILEASNIVVEQEPWISGISFLPLSPDLIARKNNEVYIIEIKRTIENDFYFPAETASQIMRTSGAVISSERYYVNAEKVKPILILIGGKISKSLELAAKDQNITIVHIDEKFIQKALSETNESDLKEMANKIINRGDIND